MNRKLLLASASVLTLFASPALAQSEGFYIGVGGGANIIHGDDINGNGFDSEFEHDAGFVGAGTLGYKYDNGFRNEIELGYRANKVDQIANVDAEGDTEVYSAMVNLLFDLELTDSNIDTYIGVGAGGALVRHDKAGLLSGTRVDDSDFTPAFQGIAGISYALSDKADLYMNYQYFHAADPNFSTESNIKVDADYDSSNIMLGLRVNLSGDMPAHARAPRPSDMVDSAYDPVMVADSGFASAPESLAAPISRTYIIFFDLDDTRVTGDARAILAQAAEDSRAGNAVSIQVVGHADASGGDDYNMGLSQRRASSVEHALSNMGVNANAMDTIARGETDLLVPTADGVKEPQNRRVEVTYIINP
ncbi:MAG: outer membrane beta-barrel protein [Rickettsiales bacterium]|nr:outer membrane beta-barrel protein [Rickettsiales bacterium]